jgi:hypothetical protein
LNYKTDGLSVLVRTFIGTDNDPMLTTRASTIRAGRGRPFRFAWPAGLLLLGAPLASVLGGVAGEWLDFRALRVPLLVTVGFGVLATAYAMHGTHGGWRRFAATVLIGAGTWAAAQSIYAVLHVASGEQFHAERFGPQWSQAIALVAAHGAFLGAPTGVAVALILRVPIFRARPARPPGT